MKRRRPFRSQRHHLLVLFVYLWRQSKRLAERNSFRELSTWKGALGLLALWGVMVLLCWLAPLWAMLKLAVHQGGWRIIVCLVMLAALLAAMTIAVQALLSRWG